MFNKKTNFLELESSGETVISIIANDFDDGDCTINEKELKEELPILPLRIQLFSQAQVCQLQLDAKNRKN